MRSRLFCGFPGFLLLLGICSVQPPATALKPIASRRAMIEKAIVQDLQEHVGMAQRWEVKLTPDDTASGDGAEVISEAVVRGINVRVPEGPLVSEMVLALREVEIDPSTNEIAGAKHARMTGTFRAEDLETFVGSQETGAVDRLHIHCRPGAMVVKAVAHAHGFGIPVAVRGAPKIRGTQILFDLDRASVMHVRVPRRFIDKLEAKVNPLADLSGMDVPARLDRISIGEGTLVAEGSLDMTSGLGVSADAASRDGGR